MEIVELFIDEEDLVSGIDAISIVSAPAIEEEFVALKNQEFKLTEIDTEKRLLLGPALIPNKPIYRKTDDKEYYIYFSRKTVRKASELFFQRAKQSRSTIEHKLPLEGLTVVESWIVEGDKDKTRIYNMDVPIGTWMISMKVNNDDIWNDYVKTGKVKGFSIEGYFADRLERPHEPNKFLAECNCEKALQECNCDLNDIEEQEAKEILSSIKGIIKTDKRYKSGKTLEVETFNDYPETVLKSVKKGLKLYEKNKCTSQVSKTIAQRFLNREKISIQTIKRMYNYLEKAEEKFSEENDKSCGYISYLLWGGKSGRVYAKRKIKSLNNGKIQ